MQSRASVSALGVDERR